MQALNDHNSYNAKAAKARKINRKVFEKMGFALLAVDSKGDVANLTE